MSTFEEEAGKGGRAGTLETQETLGWAEPVGTQEILNWVEPAEDGLTDRLTFEEEPGGGG